MKKLLILTFLLFVLLLNGEVESITNESEVRGLFFQETSNIDWEVVTQIAKDYKINMIVLECLSTYGSCYPSKYDLYSKPSRDELALAIQAAHSRGIEVHVMMLNFFIWSGFPTGLPIPEDWKVVKCDGSRANWADPCHPKVRELTKNLTEELANNYDIDGFMFDYIRYDFGYDASYSQYCKEWFENDTGINVTNWPADVCSGGPYYRNFREWRVTPVTKLVEDVRNWILAIKPNLEFSAAVFTIFDNAPPYWRYDIGQDTANWIKENYLDMVNPMVYTTNVEEYKGYLLNSTRYFIHGPEGKIPLVVWSSGITGSNTPEQIKDIINTCREVGCDGWIIWKYGGLGSPSPAGDVRTIFHLVDLPDTFSLGNIQTFPASTEATITWTTDKPTTSKVEYNSSPLFTSNLTTGWWGGGFPYWEIKYIPGVIAEDNSNVTTHAIILTNLKENTTYYFRVQSKDESGIVTSKVYNFTTGIGEYPISITGTIIDLENGLPIKAIVSCDNSGNISDSNGKYIIKLKSAGSCDLTASKFGYKSKSIPISFSGSVTYDIDLEPIKVNITGRLRDKDDNPVQGNVSVYKQENLISSTQTDSQGNYNLPIKQAIYEIQYNILNFLKNFWIRFPSLNILSSLYDVVKEVTIYPNKISFTTDIKTNQIIQINSKMPRRVLLNGMEIGNVSSLSTLKSNQWYYDSINKKLYLKLDPYPKTDCIHECCKNETYYYDKTCPPDKYCSENVCKPKTSCPFECCINEETYLDKYCPSPKYCVDRKCVEYSGYWKFDEGSGNIAYDSSGLGNNGTLYDVNTINDDGDTPPVWSTNCKSGYCLNFDGVDDAIHILHSPSLNLYENFTLEAWVYPTGPWSGAYPGIIAKYWPDGYLLAIDNSSQKYCLWLSNEEGSTIICSDSVVTFNQWTHLAVVRENDQVKMYINGTLQSSSGTLSGPITPSNRLEIGEWDNRRFFNGTIDEVRFYNRALSEEEIKTHASA